MGVPADGPGRSAAHFTPWVRENLTGSPDASPEPLKCGPRQLGQSWALTNWMEPVNKRDVKIRFFIRTAGLFSWGQRVGAGAEFVGEAFGSCLFKGILKYLMNQSAKRRLNCRVGEPPRIWES